MSGTIHKFVYPGLLAGFLAMLALSAQAEVTDSGTGGFSIRHRVMIDAPRLEVYNTLVSNVGAWWHPDHTVSGNAQALYIDGRVLGCFCEVLDTDAGLVHMTVSFANPGVMLRMTGGLGPLGLLGVAGNMTFEFDDAGEGTLVTLRYAVGGYHPDGLQALAEPVDGVLVEALDRLERFMETGDPAATP